MKFGKLPNVESVDFSLPETPQQTLRTLKQYPGDQPLRIYIGATGWNMKEWVGNLYPKGTKAKEFLYQYGRQFNTIELNTTHYRIPSVETVKKWKASVPGDFKFCPKIPQSISHSRNLDIGSGQIELFCDTIRLFADNLGCSFMQLPPYFDTSRWPILEKFLRQFPENIPLAIELRHESWFASPKALDPVLAQLKSKGHSLVITDVAGRRDVLHLQLSADLTMVRFVGNGLHPTDFQRAKDWVERLSAWQQLGLHTVYFFPHQPDNILTPEISRFLLEQIDEKMPDAIVRGPSPQLN